jgi:hypothetical protein
MGMEVQSIPQNNPRMTPMDEKDLLIQSLLSALENHNGNHVLGNAEAKSMNLLIESAHDFIKKSALEESDEGISASPRTNFTGSLVARFGKTFDCRRALGIVDRRSFEDTVLQSTPLNDVEWSTLFAYMHRRFGPPHLPGDDYKDLSGGWMLATPDPDLFVRVLPSLSGAGFSIAPYLNQSSSTRTERHDFLVSSERIQSLKVSYETALLDLLRPVCVHDSHINAMGRVDDDSHLLDYDDISDEPIFTVDRYVHSGQVTPLGFFGGKEFASLCGLVHHLGGGDIEAGRGLVVQMLRDQVFEEASQQSMDIKRLILMSNLAEPDRFQKGLKLTDAELANLVEEAQVMYRVAGHEEGGQRCVSLINSITDDQVALATSFLERLGMDNHHFRYMIKNVRIDGATQAGYWALGEIVGQDDCPELDCALTFPAGGTNAEIQSHFRTAFEQSNRPDLVAWLDETIARPFGETAFNMLACHFKKHIEETRNEEVKSTRKRGSRP